MIYKLSRPQDFNSCSVQLPASKSISNRLLIIHAIGGGKSEIIGISDSDDTHFMLKAMNSGLEEKDVGPAGTAMRFLTAYFSLIDGRVIMTGSERMKNRPIGPLVEALRMLGAKITYLEKEGYPPMEIQGGKLTGNEISIDSSISSQFISALLMIGPALENGLRMKLEGEGVSASYIKMTLELMKQYGAAYEWNGRDIKIEPGNYHQGSYRVESDWSAASYWYIMPFLQEGLSMELSFLEQNSLQGDSALVAMLAVLGVESVFSEGKVSLHSQQKQKEPLFSYDFTNCPDIVQTMAVALCLGGQHFHFTGTKTLRIKETDRIEALQNELSKLGYILESNPEGSFLSWKGTRREADKEAVIETYHDHRMAMAFAPAALALGTIQIKDPDVVSKSYPGFWRDLQKAGFRLEELH